MKRFHLSALICAMVLAASSAQAVTIAKDFTVPTPEPSVATPTSTTGDVRLNFMGSDLDAVAPNSRSPWEGTVFEATGKYNSVSAGAMATHAFGGQFSQFSLMWGSPDDYNTLEFFLSGGLVASVSGADVYNPPTPGMEFVNVTVTGLLFDTVKFSSSTDAFEYALIEAVPLPAALPLLASAFGLLAFMGRRRTAA